MPSRIFGWSPLQQEGDDIDANTQNTGVLTFNVASSQDASSHSSDTYLYQSAVNSDTKPSKRGDPSWVARPRNAFIIFRCEYCREHARGAAPADGKSSPHNDKTLSKRAGEAWRSLPAAEKKHFKVLAEKEKIEHAIAHPGYRYRPTKRTPSEKRRHRRGRHSSSADTRSRSRESSVEGDSPATQVDDLAPSTHEPTRRLKRRSISVPLDALDPTSVFLSIGEKDGLRRSRSVNQSAQPLLNYTDTQGHPGLFEVAGNTSSFNSPNSTASPALSGCTAPDYQGYHLSPLAAVSSTLTGWNGDPMPHPMPPSLSRVPSSAMSISAASLSSWTTDSSSSGVSSPALLSQTPDYALYQGESYPGLSRPQFALAGDSSSTIYDSQPNGIFWQNGDVMQAFAGFQGGQYSLPDAARANALHDYGVGLAQRLGIHGESMPFDMRSAEEQALFEGFCGY